MHMQRLAAPGNSKAHRALTRYEAFLKLPTYSKRYFFDEFIDMLWRAMITSLGTAPISIKIAGHEVTPLRFLAAWAIASVAVATCYFLISNRREVRIALSQKPRKRYNNHVGAGTIIEVPVELVDAWDMAAGNLPDFTDWDEYAKRRFAALRNLTLNASHLIAPLLNECQCDQPDECPEVTHLEISLRDRLVEQLMEEMDEEFRTHLDALESIKAGKRAMRDGYNEAVRSAVLG